MVSELFIPEQQALQGDAEAAATAALRLADGEPRARFAATMIAASERQPHLKAAAWEAFRLAWRSREANYLIQRQLTSEGVARAFADLAPSSGVTFESKFTLYRGVRIGPDLIRADVCWWLGASWTTSLETAAFFACDYWMNPTGLPAVAQITVDRRAVAFHLDDGEQEYILTPDVLRSLGDPSYAHALLGLRVEGRRGYKSRIIGPEDVLRWREASARRNG